ncbi:MAG: hypothetical protein RMA76_36515 [Deltaproteobacteria bacterium]|jgi:hypothetical protein
MNALGRCLIASLLFGMAATAAPDTAHADEVVLLLNKRNPTKKIPRGKVVSMFLGNTAFWHGVVPVKLVVRGAKTDAGNAFYEPVVQMTGARYEAYWTSRQLAGQGVKPQSADTITRVVELLKKNPGAISFALASEVEGQDLAGVKVVKLP